MKRDYKTLFWVLASLLVAFCACAVDPLYVGRFTGNAGGTTNVVGNMLRAELFGVTPYRPALPLAAGAISPTNLTDSTSAIQTLLNGAAMLASTNQEFSTVRLPWGIYLCKSQLLIPPRVSVEGEGGYLHSAGWGGTIPSTFTNAPFTIIWFPSYYTNDGVIMTNSKAGQNVLRRLEICGGTNCLAPLGNSFSDPVSFEMLPSGVLRQGRGLVQGPALAGGQLIEDVSVCGFTVGVDVIGGNAYTWNRCQWGGNDFQFQCTNASGVYDQFILNTPGSGCRRGGIEYVLNTVRNMTIINPDTLEGFGNQVWNCQITIIGGNFEYSSPSSGTEAPARCYVASALGPVLSLTNGWWQANQQGTGVGLLTNNGIWNVEYDFGNGTSSSLIMAVIGSRITSPIVGVLHHTFVHSGIQGTLAKVNMMNCDPNWVVDTQNGVSTFIQSDDTTYPPEASATVTMSWERHDSTGNTLAVIPITPPAYTNIFVADKQFTYVSGKLVSVFSPTNTGVAAAFYGDTLISGLATNGSTVYWPDLSFKQLNLTNQAASSTWPTTAWTNGFPTVRTAVGKYLIQTAYANTQPFEVIAVSQYYGVSVSDAILYDSATGGTRATLEVDDGTNSDKDDIYAGSTLLGSVHAKNKFRIIDAVFNGTASSIYTNGVLEVTGDAGANNPSGFTLSGLGGTPTSNGSPSDTPFLLALSGTNTVANRAALVTYLKNRFNVQ